MKLHGESTFHQVSAEYTSFSPPDTTHRKPSLFPALSQTPTLYVQGKQSFETHGIEVCHDSKLIRSLICTSPWRMH